MQLLIPGHPHRITLSTFLKVCQNTLPNITIWTVLVISLLERTLLLIYSNYVPISFILPQDPLRLSPAGLKFTTACCFYWQEPEYKSSIFFFLQSQFQEGHSYPCLNNSFHFTALGTKPSEISFLCILTKSPEPHAAFSEC